MKIKSLTIVGLGFMGGSLAAAARTRAGVSTILGIDPCDEHRQAALELGLVDQAFSEISAENVNVDAIVVCAPVNHIGKLVLQAAALCPSTTLLTDVGSTRQQIVETIESQLPTDRLYVGSHPLAGSEKHGPRFANAGLFQGRLTVLTPTERTPPLAIESAEQFWQQLGSRCNRMSPAKHDEALAYTSHMPHLVSYALCQILPEEYRSLTASGFRDMSRLAGSDVALWLAIIQQNQHAVASSLTNMIESLQQMNNEINEGEWESLAQQMLEGFQTKQHLG